MLLLQPRLQRQVITCSTRQTELPGPLQPAASSRRTLKLLTFNIQVGITTSAYHQYLTRCWKHLLPHSARDHNLQQIARLLWDFDLVALQEVDGGSLRTRRINQVERLAQLAGFPYWYQQLNRNLAPFAQHSNGLLSRVGGLIEDHPLPGPTGRGAIVMHLGEGEQRVAVVMMHLALGNKVRNLQLAYVRELLQDYRHYILMGDLNTHVDDLLYRSPLRSLPLKTASTEATFPSWNPQRCLDHILLSPELETGQCQVLPYPVSDHLPVATELVLPPHYPCENHHVSTR